MMEIAIMIEGQAGLNWAKWQRLALTIEDLGFAGLYRSDHYTNANPPDKDSLELWTSLTWLASHTSRIEFGPLVSPVSFRDPTMTARMASAVDDLSGGRLTLGMGAGWQEREHTNYGWDLLDVSGRFDRFEEALQIVSRLLHEDEPVDFEGHYYRLKDAVLLPRPSRPGGPPLLIGGNGPKRTLPLVARYAVAWNGVFIAPPRLAELNRMLDQLLIASDRRPEEVHRSVMVGSLFARHEEELAKKLADKNSWWFNREPEELRQNGLVIGTPGEFREQLQEYAAAGAQRIMLQWLDLDDLEGLESLALEVI